MTRRDASRWSPRPRSMRRAAHALLVSTCALSGACGEPAGPPEGPLRVRAFVAPLDPGPLPDGSVLRDASGRTFPLQRAGEDPEHLVASGPAGRYEVRAPADWGVVVPEAPLSLAPNAAEQDVWVGRAHTLYLHAPSTLAITAVDLRRLGGDGPLGDPVPFRLESDGQGRTALRLDPAEWHGPLRIVALANGSHFTAAVATRPRAGGAPSRLLPTAGPTVALAVRLVANAGTEVAGLEVTVESRVGDLVARVSARTDAHGRASFPEVPAAADATQVTVAREGGAEATFAHPGFLASGSAVLYLPPVEGAVRWRLAVAPVGPREDPPQVLIRPEGALAYGTARWTRAVDDPAIVEVRLATGRYSQVVWRGSTASASRDPFEVPPEGLTWTPGVTSVGSVRATVEGGYRSPGQRYDLVALLLDGEQAVEVQGVGRRGISGRSLTVPLPVGTWRLFLRGDGREGPVRQVRIDRGGTQYSITLPAPP